MVGEGQKTPRGPSLVRATAVHKCVVERRERKRSRGLKHHENRQNWRQGGGEEQPALLSEAMVMSQPMVPPRAMSGSIALQQQGSVSSSVTHVTTDSG